MPTPLTGNTRLQKEQWVARVTIAKNNRVTIHLPTCRKQDEEKARERGELLGKLGKQLRESRVDLELAVDFLKRAGATDPPALDAVVTAVGMVCRGEAAPRLQASVTVKQFGEQWTSGELHRRYPDNVKLKRSAQDDAERLGKYVYPVIGDVPLRELKLDHATAVMAGLPAKLSRSTRRHVAQVLARLLTLAVFPARLIPGSPIPKGFLPPPAGRKAFSFLYPDEDRRLLACAEIPLAYRMAYGFLAREGMRRSEAAALTWRDLDLERGGVALDVNKTDDPRAWALDPGVVRALRAWREMRRRAPKSTERVFIDEAGKSVIDRGDGKNCERLREHLKTAGVTRAELFERSEVRQPLRMHDLRATFITISLANGKTETWVADRTGHTSSVMINRYRRAARRVSELALGDMVALDAAVPELPKTPPPTPEPTPDPGPGSGPDEAPAGPPDQGPDPGSAGDPHRSEPSRTVATGDQNAIFSAALAEEGLEPSPPGRRADFESPSSARTRAFPGDLAGSDSTNATDRDEWIHIRAVRALIESGGPRPALVRLLSVLLGELMVAGDHAAARVARDALDRLMGIEAAPGDERAEVVDLAARRKDHKEGP